MRKPRNRPATEQEVKELLEAALLDSIAPASDEIVSRHRSIVRGLMARSNQSPFTLEWRALRWMIPFVGVALTISLSAPLSLSALIFTFTCAGAYVWTLHGLATWTARHVGWLESGSSAL